MVTEPCPFFVVPPDVSDAEIVTGPPSATDVTKPEPFTVAIVSSLDDHVGVPSPLMLCPF